MPQKWNIMINKLSKQIYHRNIEKGFYDDEKNIAEMLCLIHSEVSEALECDRKDKYCDLDNENWTIDGKTLREDLVGVTDLQFKPLFEMSVKDTFEDELADIMIRTMDLAGFLKIDLEAHISAKMRYNRLREYKHGKKY